MDRDTDWLRVDFVQRHAQQAIRDTVAEFKSMLEMQIGSNLSGRVESPIEAVFLAYWTAMGYLGAIGPDITLRCQHEIDLGDSGRFRVDFLAAPSEFGFFAPLRATTFPGVVIEVDGHDFHERTVEQVSYRNRRDRALQVAGWPVLHCSGSELNRRGSKVVHGLYLDAIKLMSARRHAMTE